MQNAKGKKSGRWRPLSTPGRRLAGPCLAFSQQRSGGADFASRTSRVDVPNAQLSHVFSSN
jgi:hypothetical protein